MWRPPAVWRSCSLPAPAAARTCSNAPEHDHAPHWKESREVNLTEMLQKTEGKPLGQMNPDDLTDITREIADEETKKSVLEVAAFNSSI